MIKQIKERDKEFVIRLVFDPRVGPKRFITSLKNLFDPTRGSNTSRITNSLPLFYLLNHTLNFQNWRLICVLQIILLDHKVIDNHLIVDSFVKLNVWNICFHLGFCSYANFTFIMR